MASFASRVLSKDLKSDEPLTLVRIISAERKSGTVYYGYKCDIEVELKDGENEPMYCNFTVLDPPYNHFPKNLRTTIGSFARSPQMGKCSCCSSSWEPKFFMPI